MIRKYFIYKKKNCPKFFFFVFFLLSKSINQLQTFCVFLKELTKNCTSLLVNVEGTIGFIFSPNEPKVVF